MDAKLGTPSYQRHRQWRCEKDPSTSNMTTAVAAALVGSPSHISSPTAQESDKANSTAGEAAEFASMSSSSSLATSRDTSADDLIQLTALNSVNSSPLKRRTLEERRRIPPSAFLTWGLILSLQYFSGMYSLETLENWVASMKRSLETVHNLLVYSRDLTKSFFYGELQSWKEFVQALVVMIVVGSMLHVFFIAPFRAGLWTGPRSRKAIVHRYMGLFFLIQYALAWVEFLTDYEKSQYSILPHAIAINGVIQGWSAFFSFKVLPDLDDAGYFSDKAVLSRKFVHENIFFGTFCIFGSVYYHDKLRETMRSSIGGRIVELIFVFFPYALIRPFFPITRFKYAGTTRKGRTEKNQYFYETGTIAVKIFYLWAKYFLGFYLNFLVFLGLTTPHTFKLIHGLFLLNAGTSSLAVFLHTLRFKKVLPPKFTFSIYLAQIYATFSALPYMIVIFASHPKLCLLTSVGLIGNMTRSRMVHAVWCVVTMLLLTQTQIQW